MAKWHQDNKVRRNLAIKERNASHKRAMKEWLYELKGSTPCADCNLYWPHYVMQFDHLPQFEKVDDISRLVNKGWSKGSLLTEIAKCELVCANDHAIRTYKRAKGLE